MRHSSTSVPRRRSTWPLRLAPLILLSVSPAPYAVAQAPAETKPDRARDGVVKSPDVIYLPTPQQVVDRMLQVADVKKTDVVYDLGCGDGRIVVTAARKHGARGVGMDVDPDRLRESRENVRKNGVEKLVTIKQADLFEADLSGASVITLYLLPELNDRLLPKLKQLKPGTRIVSHDFAMRGAKPKKVVTVHVDDDEEVHTIYLWVVPWQDE